MSYFWANLGAHLLISLLLLIVFLKAAKNTQQNRWSRGFLYLIPVVLMIILLVQLAVFSIPRVLDTTCVLRSTYHVHTGTIEKINYFKNHITVDGKTFYVNPFDFELNEGDEVVVKYTPYAHYAYSMELAVEDEPES
ncbi:MAG: hypothetical protein IKG93_11900 [Clostridiales bacterium]|nr:hypothetical protein [Clostridiales bacterium]